MCDSWNCAEIDAIELKTFDYYATKFFEYLRSKINKYGVFKTGVMVGSFTITQMK